MLINLVEEFSIAAGIPKPGVYVMNVNVPKAFATGRIPGMVKFALRRALWIL